MSKRMNPSQPQAPARRRFVTHLLGAGVAAVGGAVAPAFAAAPWPNRPIRLLVGFPGGSSPDLVARTIADPLSQALGQPVVVDNRSGAGGNIAAGLLAHATDDHTLAVLINGNMTIAKILNPALNFDPLKDLAPVSLLTTAPLLLVASTHVHARGAEVLQEGRRAGNRWSYGSPGVSTVAHLGMEMLKASTGWAAEHVPYPGNPQVINALVVGDVQVALLPPGLAMPQVRAGKLQVIGVTSTVRSALVPDVPSLVELGVKGFQLDIWDALAAPASLPRAQIARLSDLLAEIVRRPDVREKLYSQGWQVAGQSSEALAQRIATETQHMRGVIERNHIRAQ